MSSRIFLHPTTKNGLDEYQIDMEEYKTHRWRSLVSRFKSITTINKARARENLVTFNLIFCIFILPNIVAVIMAFFYIYGSVNPLSSVAAALHATRSSWLCYQIFMPVVTIAAGLANLVILLGGIRVVMKSFILSCFAAITAFAPIWCPYVIEAALRKHIYSVACNGFDGAIYLDAVNYNQAGLSVAQFPAAFGGKKWQLYQSDDGIYQFVPQQGGSQITYNFRNETYSGNVNTTTEAGAFTDTDVPLAFPELGLSSEGNWIRSCFAPAVQLKGPFGHVIVKTGLTTYTDCSKMEVCAMKSMGADAVIVAIGRLLIALESGAKCCTRSRWG